MVVAVVAAILVVDRAGRVLLQLRDGSAPVFPDKWSLVGGHLESDETPEVAARREVLEESAIDVRSPLEPVFEGTMPSGDGPDLVQWHVFAAPTAAGDADIVVGEGADIVFVPPGDVAGLDLTPSAALLLPEFLGSPLHLRLTAAAARG
jgi:8-oxo-dGTP pyrophosphatase MutT (NUDIX family)